MDNNYIKRKEPEYIERNSLLDVLANLYSGFEVSYDHGIGRAITVVKDMPTEHVRPWNHGEWEDNHTTCSYCGWQMIDDITQSRTMLGFNFCPNCGTDMRYHDGY